MRKKRIMVIGPSGCGKTALSNAINGCERPLRRTQDAIYGKNTLDVPGSYIEHPDRYKHLISLAQDASHILVLVDQERPIEKYSPGFAKVFRCQVVGVIMKKELNPENEEICHKILKKVGISEPYFKVSVNDKESIEHLKEYLLDKKSKGGEL